jgi:hypothetical protein
MDSPTDGTTVVVVVSLASDATSESGVVGAEL